MATLNKWSVLVWVIQDSHLWALLARVKLAVVIVPVSLCLGNGTLHPHILEITSELQWAASQFFFTWSDSRGLFYLVHILRVPTGACLVSVWVKIILGYFNLSYSLSPVLWGKPCVQKLFLLCISIPFRMTLYWQSSIKGPYRYWELDPLIWMKN